MLFVDEKMKAAIAYFRSVHYNMSMSLCVATCEFMCVFCF